MDWTQKDDCYERGLLEVLSAVRSLNKDVARVILDFILCPIVTLRKWDKTVLTNLGRKITTSSTKWIATSVLSPANVMLSKVQLLFQYYSTLSPKVSIVVRFTFKHKVTNEVTNNQLTFGIRGSTSIRPGNHKPWGWYMQGFIWSVHQGRKIRSYKLRYLGRSMNPLMTMLIDPANPQHLYWNNFSVAQNVFSDATDLQLLSIEFSTQFVSSIQVFSNFV
jgi:hypothetical protein